MLFNKNDDRVNERIIYKSKPNMLFGCKKAIYGVILLIVVLTFSPVAIQFIGNMQVYLISYVNLALTRYAAIAFFVLILFIIIYILWQLFGWYAKEYIITDSRVIIKSGVLSTKKNYMPYATIQDINTSQSIIGKIFGVGSINLYSAYDNNQMELSGISNVSEMEDIIFTNMVNSRKSFERYDSVPFNNNHFDANYQTNDDYDLNEDYYDEFEPITPIGHEKREFTRNEYEYYPEDISYGEQPRGKYEYEPYDGNLYNRSERSYEQPLRRNDAMNSQDNYHGSVRDESPLRCNDAMNSQDGFYDSVRDESPLRRNGAMNSQDNYYGRVRDEYSYRDDNQYQNDNSGSYYDDDRQKVSREESRHDDSSENAIRRHFDKFKK